MQKKETSLDDLPADALMLILKELRDPKYLCSLRLNKKLRSSINAIDIGTFSQQFWQECYTRDFGYYMQIDENLTFRQNYMLRKRYSDSFLTQKHKKLFDWIRRGDTESIKKETYQLGSIKNYFITQEKILNDFCDVYEDGNRRYNAIKLARHFQRSDILSHIYSLMCEKVFSHNQTDISRRTRIFWAIMCGNFEEFNRLLPSQELTDRLLLAQLLFPAIEYNSGDCLALLINTSGVNINGSIGDLPLISIAIDHKMSQIVKLLIEMRADVNMLSSQNASPLDFATQRDNIEIVKILLMNGARMNREFLVHCMPRNWLSIINLVLRAKAIDKDLLHGSIDIAKGHNTAAYELLLLWELKILHQEKPLSKQIIEILHASLTAGISGFFKSVFFAKSLPLELIKELQEYQFQKGENEILTLRNLCEKHQSELPPVKYNFIMSEILQQNSSAVEQVQEHTRPSALKA